jgi:hypothetical protein
MTGWFLDMKSLNGDKVSRTDFLKYLIMRRSELSHIQRCGRLSLEFYCDAWASHEASLMEFHKRPQQQALYRSVTRAAFVDQLPHSDANDIGVPMRTILPASVVGSEWIAALNYRPTRGDVSIYRDCIRVVGTALDVIEPAIHELAGTQIALQQSLDNLIDGLRNIPPSARRRPRR